MTKNIKTDVVDFSEDKIVANINVVLTESGEMHGEIKGSTIDLAELLVNAFQKNELILWSAVGMTEYGSR